VAHQGDTSGTVVAGQAVCPAIAYKWSQICVVTIESWNYMPSTSSFYFFSQFLFCSDQATPLLNLSDPLPASVLYSILKKEKQE
jgi:hypothetical protein